MANRFAVGDTLGFQVYNQYLNQEIARKRAEEERRKQEEQRSKAKKHNAFGQLVNTAGSVIGAGIGAATGGVPGALAGYQMGSAGSNLLMNLFPNIGSTEPDSSNPYYDKPSNMQVANQALGVGLQAYGKYNQYLGEQAKANLVDFTKSLITDPSRSQAMTVDEIKTAIKESKEYEDAKGIFGESVISDNTISQIAQNAYDGIGQQAIKMFDMIQKASVNEGTQGMIDKWYNRYGTAYNNLLPEGMKENLTTSVTETVDKNTYDSQMNQLDLAIKQQQVAAGGQSQTINAQNIEKNEQTIAAGDLAAQEAKIKGQINLMTAAIKNTSLTGNEVGTNIWTAAEKAGVSEEMIQTFKIAEDSAKAEYQINKNATATEKQGKLLKIYQDTLKDIPADDPNRKVLIDSMMSSLSTGNGANSLVPVETTKALLASTADYDAETTTDAIAEALEKDLNNIVIDSLGQGSKQLKKGEIASILYNLDEEDVDQAINKVKIKKFGSLEKFNTYLDQMVASDPEALEPDETANMLIEFFKSLVNSSNVSEEQLRLQDAVKRGGE